MPDGTNQRIYSTSLLGSPVAGGGPQIEGSLYDWMYAGTTSALLHGNAWGLITNRGGIPGPDGLGLPTGVAWLPADKVYVQDDSLQPENPLKAQIYYQGRQMDRQNLVQLKAFAIPGQVEGVSPLKLFNMLWAQGLEALKYSADWFNKGGFPPGTFQNISEDVDDGQAKEIRRRLTDAIQLRQPLVYGRDWDYKALTVPQDEATFIQSMQLNATQIAAIYGVQPYRVGGTRNDGLTYSNVTMNLLDELTTTLRPWLTRWEHLLTAMLPNTQYVKFDVDDMLRMDPRSRHETAQIQRNTGTMTVNEIRAEDDRPPLPGGDEAIPLAVLERMLSTTRTIPNSYLSQVSLEAELIANLIGGYEKSAPEMFTPQTAQRPPLKSTSPQYLANLITQVRSALPGEPGEGGTGTDETLDAHRKAAIALVQALEHAGRLTQAQAAERVTAIGDAASAAELAAALKGLPEPPGATETRPAARYYFGPGEFRCSNEDRKRAGALLAMHRDRGRLNENEYTSRATKAGEAVTCRDLDTLFADLPAEELAAAPPEDGGQAEAQPLFGPAAMALLRSKADGFNQAAPAAMNGKAHLNGGHVN